MAINPSTPPARGEKITAQFLADVADSIVSRTPRDSADIGHRRSARGFTSHLKSRAPYQMLNVLLAEITDVEAIESGVHMRCTARPVAFTFNDDGKPIAGVYEPLEDAPEIFCYWIFGAIPVELGDYVVLVRTNVGWLILPLPDIG